MADFNSRQEDEIEKLSRTLRSSKLATSESEARRMAEEMLGISKKVADDFKKREQQILGDKKMSAEQDLAHKQMEMLAANIASGKSNARIDLSDLKGVDINKPLKDLIAQEEEPANNDDDDAEDITPDADESVIEVDDVVELGHEEKAVEDDSSEEPDSGLIDKESSWDKPVEDDKVKESEQEVEELDLEEDGSEPDDSEGGSEEERLDEVSVEDSSDEPDDKGIDPEAAEEDDSEGVEADDDFSVKELDSATVKSDDDRKREIESMAESKIDLSNVFNANK